MKITNRILVILLLATALASAGTFEDDFSDPALESRQALRGEWSFNDNTAHCIADPELYKKFKNHGPILRWPAAFTDGTITFEMKPEDCQRIVITLNEDGHLFRIALSDEKRTRIFGWATKSSKENKPETLVKKGVPTSQALNNQWVKVQMTFKGDEATVQIGDFKVPLKHACIARKKGEFTISFASGALAVRPVSLRTTE